MGKSIRLTAAAFAASMLFFAACSGDDDGASVRTLADCGSASTPASASGAAAASSGSSSTNCPPGSGSGTGSGVVAQCVPVGDIATATTKIDVSLDEWTIIPSAPSAPSGRVGFVVRNRGKEAHELVIVKGVEPNELPLDDNGALEEAGLPTGALVGEIEGFAAGESCEGVFDLTPGAYTLVCNITETEPNGEKESHLREGMVTTFTVT